MVSLGLPELLVFNVTALSENMIIETTSVFVNWMSNSLLVVDNGTTRIEVDFGVSRKGGSSRRNRSGIGAIRCT